MSRNQSSQHINDFTDYRLTGDLRISPESTSRQVHCYKYLFGRLGKRSDILDDACRDGRVAVPLAQFYKQVTGVEVNHDLIEAAKQLGAVTKNACFLEEDVRQLSLSDNSFDGVLSAFSSWGVYGPEGDQQSLREMARVLKPGGILVLDWGNISARLREIEKNGVFNKKLGRKVIYELFETPNGEAVVRTSWMDDDLGYHWVCQRVGYIDPLVVGLQPGYLPVVIEQMLQDAGLQVVATYGNYELEPVSDKNNRLIIKAVRQG